MWQEFNNNPTGRRGVGDCSVRAVSVALGIDWDTAYLLMTTQGFADRDMPSSNAVTGAVLRRYGFKRATIPNSCPNCYTVKDFCRDNKKGIFMLGTGTHVVTEIDGSYYDSWDSGDEIPVYVWYKGPTPVFGS